MKKNTTSTVLLEHKQEADEFITEMEKEYIPSVEVLIKNLKVAGIKKPIEEVIPEILKGHFSNVLYKSSGLDIIGFLKEKFGGTIGNDYVDKPVSKSFKELISNKNGSEKWGHTYKCDPKLFEFIKIEKDKPILLTDLIYEEFREYATPVQEEIVQAQKEAADALNNLVNTTRKYGVEFDRYLFMAYFTAFFRVFQDEKTGKDVFASNLERISKF